MMVVCSALHQAHATPHRFVVPDFHPQRMSALTKRQEQIVTFIADHMETYDRPPTGTEIADHFGWSSHATAYEQLRWIEKKGYLVRERSGARGPMHLSLTDKARHLVNDAWMVLGRIPAGPLSDVAGEHLDTVAGLEDLVPVSLKPGDYFLRVDGDSMVDAGLSEGALVVVRSTQEATSGDICAVWVDGDGGTLKTVRFEDDTVHLVPQNSVYMSTQYPAERVRIQGVVVAVLDMRRV